MHGYRKSHTDTEMEKEGENLGYKVSNGQNNVC